MSRLPRHGQALPMLDWHKTVNDFAGAVHEVHIISTGNECKELLLVLERERYAAPRVVCVNDEQILEYEANHGSTEDADGIAHASSDGEEPLAGTRTGAIGADRWQYLYEPNASIMKAGCFAVISQRFDVHPIGPNSHLFVSAKPVDGFPGRSFAIESIATMNKRELKQALAGLYACEYRRAQLPAFRDAIAQQTQNQGRRPHLSVCHHGCARPAPRPTHPETIKLPLMRELAREARLRENRCSLPQRKEPISPWRWSCRRSDRKPGSEFR